MSSRPATGLPDLTSKLALAKLNESGLDLADAKRLRIEVLSAAQAAKLGALPQPSLKFNYINPYDKKPLSDWPGCKPFIRLRHLVMPTDFAAIAGAKPQRYWQPVGTGCCAYFPTNIDWSGLTDAEQSLIITEGELKACSACKLGFPTIGLGGVDNWRNWDRGIELLPELDAIVWPRRKVYICFDNDSKPNPNVWLALSRLGQVLARRGAYPHVVVLPALPGKPKTGLDDYIVDAGKGAEKALREVLEQAPALGFVRQLFDMNEQYICVRSPSVVVEISNMAKYPPDTFKTYLEATRQAPENIMTPAGAVVHKMSPAAGVWMRWPLRRQAAALVYEPGKPVLAEAGLNTWRGWGCEPKAGNVRLFMELFDHLFTGESKEFKGWVMSWLAWPLQHPGDKLYTAVVIHSYEHGVGKSLLGETMGYIYGKNYGEISQAQLHSQFNEWAQEKQFILGDDVTGSDKRQDADMFKKLITQRELTINAKFLPSYAVKDCVNYWFTSNQSTAVFLEDRDRRFAVHEVVVPPLSDDFYIKYKAWLKGSGPAALFAWFLKLDTKGFNPSAKAPATDAKARMMADNLSDIGEWVRHVLLTDTDATLSVGGISAKRDLWTSKELLALYDPLEKTKVTANGMARELKKAGVRQVMGGNVVRSSAGLHRYFAVKNAVKWLGAGHAELAGHIEENVLEMKEVKY